MPPKKKGGAKKVKKVKLDKPKVPESLPDTKVPAHSESKNSFLLFTIANSDKQSMNRLLTHYGYSDSLNAVDINGSNAIHIATRKNELPILEQLLAIQPPININALEYKIVGGFSAVHHACLNGFHQALEMLLRNGANPNIKCDSTNGETPLQICCKKNNLRDAQLLMKHGAQPELKDNFGNNASFWAYKYHNDQLARELDLPPVKTASAQDFLAILLKNNPRFTLPSVKAAKGGKKGDKKGKKKK